MNIIREEVFMAYKIITHNGKAHMDELLGIVLLAYYKKDLPYEIIRMNPDEAAEIVRSGNVDDDCFFIDCGLEFSPEKRIFDHHQSKDLHCAAMLIFEQFFKIYFDTKLHDYIKQVSLVDTKGPNALDDFKYKSNSILYFSFPQNIILKEFEKNPLTIVNIFLDGISSIIDFEMEKNNALKWMENNNNLDIEKIGGINLLKYNTPPPVEIASGVKAVDGDLIEANDIHAIYSYDKEDNNIRTLYRTVKGDKKLDFTKSRVNEVQFCHRGGFLLKFKPCSTSEWIRIIKESIL